MDFFVLLLIHVAMCFISLFLEESVFMVFGVIGLVEFLSRLSFELFKDSMLFPFALTVIGILSIALGIVYQKNRQRIETTVWGCSASV